MCKEKKNIDKIDEFDDYMDNEFLDALEALEKMKKGEISPEEYEKLEFIRKSRETVVSGET